jgi:hypothetical protein
MFEQYAERLLAIPHGGEKRDFWTNFYQDVVTQARQTLDATASGG